MFISDLPFLVSLLLYFLLFKKSYLLYFLSVI